MPGGRQPGNESTATPRRHGSATDAWMISMLPDGAHAVAPLASKRRHRARGHSAQKNLVSQRGVATALLAALEHERLHPRPTGVYFGSAADVRPVVDHPSHSWVFVTPEPRHPMALKSYPKDTCGRCLGHTHPWHFFCMFLDRLGRREWVGTPSPFKGEENGPWYFARRDGCDLLRVYTDTTVESAVHSASVAAACSAATAVYVVGFCPDVDTFHRLCPRVKHVWGARHEWMGLNRYADRCGLSGSIACYPLIFSIPASNDVFFFLWK